MTRTSRDEAVADAVAFLKAVAADDADAVRVLVRYSDRSQLYLNLARLTLLAASIPAYDDPTMFLDDCFAELAR